MISTPKPELHVLRQKYYVPYPRAGRFVEERNEKNRLSLLIIELRVIVSHMGPTATVTVVGPQSILGQSTDTEQATVI